MAKVELVAIGNAIVDLISSTTDERLEELGVQKGIMQLVDTERSEDLFSSMPDYVRTAGGSAANTAIVASIMGVQSEYVSKVGTDELGDFYAESMNKDNVAFHSSRDDKNATGRTMIFVTPDGERSMNTYLGASEFLAIEDLNFDIIANAKYLYLEGYRFDGPESQEAFHKAVDAFKQTDGIAAISLSDPFCVDRYRDAFRELIQNGIDLVFCNEHELVSYTQASDFPAARKALHGSKQAFIVTAGADGAYVIANDEIIHVPTRTVEVKDATGAGDYFAGGFLAAIAKGKTFAEAAVIGNEAAREVVQVVGTRVQSDLSSLL